LATIPTLIPTVRDWIPDPCRSQKPSRPLAPCRLPHSALSCWQPASSHAKQAGIAASPRFLGAAGAAPAHMEPRGTGWMGRCSLQHAMPGVRWFTWLVSVCARDSGVFLPPMDVFHRLPDLKLQRCIRSPQRLTAQGCVVDGTCLNIPTHYASYTSGISGRQGNVASMPSNLAISSLLSTLPTV
jgi:hypothetical protein